MRARAAVTALGERLRAARHAQGVTLRTVAEKTGYTAAYLSQVETGRTSPSLASLKKIGTGYGLSLVELVADPGPRNDNLVLPPDQRRRLVFGGGGVVKELLVRRQTGKRMEPLLVTVQPGEGSEGQYDHAGEEFGLVLAGTLELTVEEQVFVLRKGDTFYFSSTRLHGFRNPSRRGKTRVLWVITPPSY
jgi:transcriptional regulator with XRE-family HTH domain